MSIIFRLYNKAHWKPHKMMKTFGFEFFCGWCHNWDKFSFFGWHHQAQAPTTKGNFCSF